MRTDLSPAIEALREQLREQEDELLQTKRMINTLLKRSGLPAEFDESGDSAGESSIAAPRYSSGVVKPDQYYGKPFATAAQEFLERRKQACAPDEILRGLEAGGFDFRALGWKDNDRLRSLSISLAKNNQKFHKLPNGMFGLVIWYPNINGNKD